MSVSIYGTGIKALRVSCRFIYLYQFFSFELNLSASASPLQVIPHYKITDKAENELRVRENCCTISSQYVILLCVLLLFGCLGLWCG